MKKFLKELQAIQDECLARTKDNAGNNPEILERPMVRSVGFDTDDKTWKKIQANLTEHHKDWRRFRRDPNKVVIEKNLLFNSLSMLPDFFIFRNSEHDACDTTFIYANREFNELRPTKNSGWQILVFIIIAIVGLYLNFAAIKNTAVSVLIAILYVLLVMIVAYKTNRHYYVKLSNWQTAIRRNPGILLNGRITSKRKLDQGEIGYYESLINIVLKMSHFFSENYQKIIYKTFDIAHKMKGEVVWLWYFGKAAKTKDLVEVENLDNDKTDYEDPIKITIKITGGNILPAIETGYSFIFCLDDFPNTMDDFGNSGAATLLKIREKMIDQTGNIGKEDMFKPYRYA